MALKSNLPVTVPGVHLSTSLVESEGWCGIALFAVVMVFSCFFFAGMHWNVYPTFILVCVY
jgi:hypothetical protein